MARTLAWRSCSVERGVGAKVLHLLEAIGEDGLDLRHLIVAEPKPLAQMHGLLAGVEVAVEPPAARRGLRRIGSGGLVGAGRLREHEPRGKQRAQNDALLPCIANCVHTLEFSLVAVVLLTGRCECRHDANARVARENLRLSQRKLRSF